MLRCSQLSYPDAASGLTGRRRRASRPTLLRTWNDHIAVTFSALGVSYCTLPRASTCSEHRRFWKTPAHQSESHIVPCVEYLCIHIVKIYESYETAECETDGNLVVDIADEDREGNR